MTENSAIVGKMEKWKKVVEKKMENAKFPPKQLSYFSGILDTLL